MSLNSSVIENGLKSTFTAMKDMSRGGDQKFADDLATYYANYLAAATVQSKPNTDSGTVGSNTYVGTSTGTGITILPNGGTIYVPAVSANPAADGLYEQGTGGSYFKTTDTEPVGGKTYYQAVTVPSLSGNLFKHFTEITIPDKVEDLPNLDNDLADNIAADIDEAMSYATIIVTTSGQQTLPNGTTSPAGGRGAGIFSGQKEGIATVLKALFAQMRNVVNGVAAADDNQFASQLATALHTYVTGATISLTFTGTVIGIGTATAS